MPFLEIFLQVYWMFNNERIEEHILTPDKALVINGVKTENEGVYVCVAENIANKRLSRPAIITVTSFSGIFYAKSLISCHIS